MRISGVCRPGELFKTAGFEKFRSDKKIALSRNAVIRGGLNCERIGNLAERI